MNTMLIAGLGLAVFVFVGFNFSTRLLDKASDISLSKTKRFWWKTLWVLLALSVIAAGAASFTLLYPFIESLWENLAKMIYLQ